MKISAGGGEPLMCYTELRQKDDLRQWFDHRRSRSWNGPGWNRDSTTGPLSIHAMTPDEIDELLDKLGVPKGRAVLLQERPRQVHHDAEADEAPAAPPLRRRRRRPWGSRRLCFQTPGDEPGEPRNMFEDTRDWGIGQGDGVP